MIGGRKWKASHSYQIGLINDVVGLMRETQISEDCRPRGCVSLTERENGERSSASDFAIDADKSTRRFALRTKPLRELT